MKKMSDSDLANLVSRRRDAALAYLEAAPSRDRREALQFYRGDNLSLYGNSGDGLSTIVSRDMMEAVESILPGLVKPFIAGDETVRFEPTGPEDEEGAKQATEYINYLFQNHNDAVRVIYDFTKDGLMFRLGVAKVVHEEVDDKTLETYRGLTQIELAALESDKDHEIIGDVLFDEETGTFEVKCSKSVKRSTFRVYVISPDEFLFEPRLASMDDGRFFGHRATKPLGDFIAMGLPKAKLMKLRTAGTTDEDDDRFEGEDERDDNEPDEDIARLVTVDECYVRCDYEGTGVLGWRKVFIGATGNTILLNEEADDHPYETWTPIPLPHKLVGMGIYDLVKDLQMQGTALAREAMNALYLANRPQREVVEGQVNFEDLLNPEVGGLVRVKQPGMVREIASGGDGVIQQSLAMMEQIATMREQRTGSTRYNQGMDANSLNKTATGISIIQNASTQRLELIARHLAEGIRGIFKKLLALTIRHQDKAQVIRLRGQWVEMNPADFKAGYDMTVAVGLGTGNKDQVAAQLTNIMNVQKQIAQAQGGLEGPIVRWKHIYEASKRLTENVGLKGTENYFDDPEAQQNQEAEAPAAPDPLAEAQAEAQLEIEKAKIKRHADIEIARIKAETNIIIEGMKMGLMPNEAAEIPAEPLVSADGAMMPPEPQMAPDEAYMASGGGFPEGDEMLSPEFGQ